MFVHHLLGIHKKSLIIGAFLFSGLLAATTPTNLYIHRLYQYDWGYIAKGGPEIQLFGLYGMLTLFYFVYQTVRQVKKESNLVRIPPPAFASTIYVIFSFCISGLLTLLNIPAMNGYDFYPAGNFFFLPLSILAYGVLRYCLMDIRSILLQIDGSTCLTDTGAQSFFLLWIYNNAFQTSRELFMMVLSLGSSSIIFTFGDFSPLLTVGSVVITTI